MTRDDFQDCLLRVRKFFVYSLWVDNVCFYVGKGTKTRRHALRPIMHEKSARLGGDSPKDKFIRRAWRAGKQVDYRLEFDSNQEHHVYFHEQVMIGHHGKRKDGGTLFNKADGGQGVSGYKLSKSTRLKMSRSRTNMHMSSEWCKSISAGRFKSPLIHRRPVVVMGVRYDSGSEAARSLDLGISKIRRWASSNKFNSYFPN